MQQYNRQCEDGTSSPSAFTTTATAVPPLAPLAPSPPAPLTQSEERFHTPRDEHEREFSSARMTATLAGARDATTGGSTGLHAASQATRRQTRPSSASTDDTNLVWNSTTSIAMRTSIAAGASRDTAVAGGRGLGGPHRHSAPLNAWAGPGTLPEVVAYQNPLLAGTPFAQEPAPSRGGDALPPRGRTPSECAGAAASRGGSSSSSSAPCDGAADRGAEGGGGAGGANELPPVLHALPSSDSAGVASEEQSAPFHTPDATTTHSSSGAPAGGRRVRETEPSHAQGQPGSSAEETAAVPQQRQAPSPQQSSRSGAASPPPQAPRAPSSGQFPGLAQLAMAQQLTTASLLGSDTAPSLCALAADTDLQRVAQNPRAVPPADEAGIRALVLSGGGMKGSAYVGVVQAMREEGILPRVRHIAGCSAGALTGFQLAMGTERALDEVALSSLHFVKQYTSFTKLDVRGAWKYTNDVCIAAALEELEAFRLFPGQPVGGGCVAAGGEGGAEPAEDADGKGSDTAPPAPAAASDDVVFRVYSSPAERRESGDGASNGESDPLPPADEFDHEVNPLKATFGEKQTALRELYMRLRKDKDSPAGLQQYHGYPGAAVGDAGRRKPYLFTFSDLGILRNFLNPVIFKDFRCTAVRVDSLESAAALFSCETTPEVPIGDAVRASMCLPPVANERVSIRHFQSSGRRAVREFFAHLWRKLFINGLRNDVTFKELDHLCLQWEMNHARLLEQIEGYNFIGESDNPDRRKHLAEVAKHAENRPLRCVVYDRKTHKVYSAERTPNQRVFQFAKLLLQQELWAEAGRVECLEGEVIAVDNDEVERGDVFTSNHNSWARTLPKRAEVLERRRQEGLETGGLGETGEEAGSQEFSMSKLLVPKSQWGQSAKKKWPRGKDPRRRELDSTATAVGSNARHFRRQRSLDLAPTVPAAQQSAHEPLGNAQAGAQGLSSSRAAFRRKNARSATAPNLRLDGLESLGSAAEEPASGGKSDDEHSEVMGHGKKGSQLLTPAQQAHAGDTHHPPETRKSDAEADFLRAAQQLYGADGEFGGANGRLGVDLFIPRERLLRRASTGSILSEPSVAAAQAVAPPTEAAAAAARVEKASSRSSSAGSLDRLESAETSGRGRKRDFFSGSLTGLNLRKRFFEGSDHKSGVPEEMEETSSRVGFDLDMFSGGRPDVRALSREEKRRARRKLGEEKKAAKARKRDRIAGAAGRLVDEVRKSLSAGRENLKAAFDPASSQPAVDTQSQGTPASAPQEASDAPVSEPDTDALALPIPSLRNVASGEEIVHPEESDTAQRRPRPQLRIRTSSLTDASDAKEAVRGVSPSTPPLGFEPMLTNTSQWAPASPAAGRLLSPRVAPGQGRLSPPRSPRHLSPLARGSAGAHAAPGLVLSAAAGGDLRQLMDGARSSRAQKRWGGRGGSCASSVAGGHGLLTGSSASKRRKTHTKRDVRTEYDLEEDADSFHSRYDFKIQEPDNREYLDGGVYDNVPTDYFPTRGVVTTRQKVSQPKPQESAAEPGALCAPVPAAPADGGSGAREGLEPPGAEPSSKVAGTAAGEPPAPGAENPFFRSQLPAVKRSESGVIGQRGGNARAGAAPTTLATRAPESGDEGADAAQTETVVEQIPCVRDAEVLVCVFDDRSDEKETNPWEEQKGVHHGRLYDFIGHKLLRLPGRANISYRQTISQAHERIRRRFRDRAIHLPACGVWERSAVLDEHQANMQRMRGYFAVKRWLVKNAVSFENDSFWLRDFVFRIYDKIEQMPNANAVRTREQGFRFIDSGDIGELKTFDSFRSKYTSGDGGPQRIVAEKQRAAGGDEGGLLLGSCAGADSGSLAGTDLGSNNGGNLPSEKTNFPNDCEVSQSGCSSIGERYRRRHQKMRNFGTIVEEDTSSRNRSGKNRLDKRSSSSSSRTGFGGGGQKRRRRESQPFMAQRLASVSEKFAQFHRGEGGGVSRTFGKWKERFTDFVGGVLPPVLMGVPEETEESTGLPASQQMRDLDSELGTTSNFLASTNSLMRGSERRKQDAVEN